MIDAKTIPLMSKDEATETLKRVHLSTASSEVKEPLILSLEHRIKLLDRDRAIVVKSDFK